MSELKVNKISPATGTAFTLGDSGDTFTVPSGATFTNSGTATGFGGGKLLAYIPTTSAVTAPGRSTTTSTSWVDIGVTSSITPSLSSSKVLVMVSCGIGQTAVGYTTFVKLVRGSTDIAGGTASGGSPSVFGYHEGSASGNGVDSGTSHSIQYIDSPASASAVTYKLMWYVNGGTGIIGGCHATGGGGTGSVGTNITLIEIGA
jgi:hypothetical protein